MVSVTNRVKRKKAYLTGRIREQVTLIKRENVLSPIKVLEIILGISPRIIIKERILKIKHKKVLQHPVGARTLKVLNFGNSAILVRSL